MNTILVQHRPDTEVEKAFARAKWAALRALPPHVETGSNCLRDLGSVPALHVEILLPRGWGTMRTIAAELNMPRYLLCSYLSLEKERLRPYTRAHPRSEHRYIYLIDAVRAARNLMGTKGARREALWRVSAPALPLALPADA